MTTGGTDLGLDGRAGYDMLVLTFGAPTVAHENIWACGLPTARGNWGGGSGLADGELLVPVVVGRLVV